MSKNSESEGTLTISTVTGISESEKHILMLGLRRHSEERLLKIPSAF